MKLKKIPLDTKYAYHIDKSGQVFRGARRLNGWLYYGQRRKEYRRIRLQLADNTSKIFYTHRLMAYAWLGLKEGQVARHLNDVGTDNRLENIMPGTMWQNQVEDRINNGTYYNRGKCPF